MADVKWIKITTDVFDDDKILLIESLPDADSIIVIWFKLLCLAGKQNNSGVFMMGNKIPYTDKMLATIFRRKENTVKLALQTFEQFGMIELIDGVITIPNWGKHQNLDQIESKKEYMKKYMKEYREKQKLMSTGQCKVNVNTLHKANVSRVDKIREEREEERDKKESRRESEELFTPPTLSEINAYCYEHNLIVNPGRFFEYYTDRGWKTSKNNRVDWQKKIEEWNAEEMQKAKAKTETQMSSNPFLALAKEENLF